MNRIDQRFDALKAKGETAFIAYITAGDPTLEITQELVVAFDEAGVDIVELGVPYSDPVADGAANQEAALRALEHGTSLRDIVAMVKQLRARSQLPVVLFTYFNPVLVYGIEALAKDAADAGIDGILCVDLPPEEAGDYKKHMDAADIATVFLIAPTSTPERIALIAQHCTGFIYYVSRTGVTGERDDIEASVHGMVEQIRAVSDKPIAVGFGISRPEHAKEVATYADGVVVGSAIVRQVGQHGNTPETAKKVAEFVKPLLKAIKA